MDIVIREGSPGRL